MRKILTPNTMYKHRSLLNLNLTKINSRLEVESLEYKSRVNFNRTIDFSEREFIKNSLHRKVPQLIRSWIFRARRMILARSQLAGILEQLTDARCIYCQRDWGLKCESIGNVEDTFNRFIHVYGIQREEVWSVREWQQYFVMNSVFRTICYECHHTLIPQVDPCIYNNKQNSPLQIDNLMNLLSLQTVFKMTSEYKLPETN